MILVDNIFEENREKFVADFGGFFGGFCGGKDKTP
jgi:hypothetical protein